MKRSSCNLVLAVVYFVSVLLGGCDNKCADVLVPATATTYMTESPGSRWVIADGSPGRLVVINPGQLPSAARSIIRLDIDCYLVGLVQGGDEIFVSAVRSRGTTDDPGGIYTVNMNNGSTSLVAESSEYGGETHSLFAGPTENPSGSAELIACNANGVFAVSRSGLVKQVLKPPPGGAKRWAFVRQGSILVCLSQAGQLYFASLQSDSSAAGWDPIVLSSNVEDLARGRLGDSIVVAMGGKWRVFKITPGSLALTNPVDLVVQYRPLLRTSHALAMGEDLVMVQSTDYPARSTWWSDRWRVESNGLSVMDAVVYNFD